MPPTCHYWFMAALVAIRWQHGARSAPPWQPGQAETAAGGGAGRRVDPVVVGAVSIEQVAADVAAGGGDLAQLVEEVHGGEVGWGEFERGPDAGGPKCHDIGEQALD